MKHTESEIIDESKKIMNDITREYYDRIPFRVSFVSNEKVLFTNRMLPACWNVLIFVHDDQWNKENDPGTILIQFDDNTGEPVYYGDGSMGRAVPMIPKKNEEGRYKLEMLIKN